MLHKCDSRMSRRRGREKLLSKEKKKKRMSRVKAAEETRDEGKQTPCGK